MAPVLVHAIFAAPGPPPGKSVYDVVDVMRGMEDIELQVVPNRPWYFYVDASQLGRLEKTVAKLGGVPMSFNVAPPWAAQTPAPTPPSAAAPAPAMPPPWTFAPTPTPALAPAPAVAASPRYPASPAEPEVWVTVDFDHAEATSQPTITETDVVQAVWSQIKVLLTPIHGQRLTFSCPSASEARTLFQSGVVVHNRPVLFLEAPPPPVLPGFVLPTPAVHTTMGSVSPGIAVAPQRATTSSWVDQKLPTSAPGGHAAPSFTHGALNYPPSEPPPPYHTPPTLRGALANMTLSEPPAYSGMPTVNPAAFNQQPSLRHPSAGTSPSRQASNAGKDEDEDSWGSDDDDDGGDDDDDDDDDDSTVTDGDSDAHMPQTISIFHDAENCFVPNDTNIDGSELYDAVLHEALRFYLPQGQAADDVDVNLLNVSWALVLRRGASNPYHISNATLESLQDRGVSHVSPGQKADAVDNKIKDLLQNFLDSHDSNKKRNARKLVVLLLGDRDYAPEMRRLRQAGFPCVLIHRGNARSSVTAIARAGKKRMDSDRWDQLVAQASRAGGNVVGPPVAAPAKARREQAPSPAAPATASAPSGGSERVGSAGNTIAATPFMAGQQAAAGQGSTLFERRVPFEVRQYLSYVGHSVLKDAVEIHENLSVSLTSEAGRHAVTISIQPGALPPPRATIDTAITNVNQLLDDGILQEPPFVVDGITSEEIRKDSVLLQQARDAGVYIFAANSRPAGPGPAKPSNSRGSAPTTQPLPQAPRTPSAGPVRQKLQLQICVPSAWGDEEIRRHCKERDGLALHRIKGPEPSAEPQRSFCWRSLVLNDTVHKPHGDARKALIDQLVKKPAVPVPGAHIRYRVPDATAIPAASASPATGRAAAPAAAANSVGPASLDAAVVNAKVSLITLASENAPNVLKEFRSRISGMAKGKATINLKQPWYLPLVQAWTKGNQQPRLGAYVTRLCRQHGVVGQLVVGQQEGNDLPGPAPTLRAGRGKKKTAGMPRVPRKTVSKIILTGRLADVKAAESELKTALGASIHFEIDVPPTKRNDLLLEALRSARLRLTSERRMALGSRSSLALSEDSRDNINEVDAENGRSAEASGQNDITITMAKSFREVLPSRSPVQIIAWGEDVDDAEEQHATLQLLVDKFAVDTVAIPPSAQFDRSSDNCHRLSSEFGTKIFFDDAKNVLVVAGDGTDVADARERIKERLSGLVVDEATIETPNEKLAMLLTFFPALADAIFAEARVSFPRVTLKLVEPTNRKGAKMVALWKLSGIKETLKAASAWLSQQLRQMASEMASFGYTLTEDQYAYVQGNFGRVARPIGSQKRVLLRMSTRAGDNDEQQPGVPGAKGGPASTKPASSQPVIRGSGSVGCIQVSVVHADWRSIAASAIVNPANNQLSHLGGLAASIAQEAGPGLQAACNQIRSVPDGGAAVTDSFDIKSKTPGPYKHIIHTVAPNKSVCGPSGFSVLQEAALNVLKATATTPATSLAMPAIGAQLYGWAPSESARAIVDAIRQYVGENQGRPLRLQGIVLFDNRKEACDAFVSALSKAASGNAAGGSPQKKQHAPVRVQRPTHQWEWRTDTGAFCPYDFDQNHDIEARYQRCRSNSTESPVIQITGDVHGRFSPSKHMPPGARAPVYDVDVRQMVQINVQSGFIRMVRRRPLQAGEYPPLTPPEVVQQPNLGSSQASLATSLAGPAANGRSAPSVTVPVVFSPVSATAAPAAATASGPTPMQPSAADQLCLHIYGRPSSVQEARLELMRKLEQAVQSEEVDILEAIEVSPVKLVKMLSNIVRQHHAQIDLIEFPMGVSAAIRRSPAVPPKRLVIRAYGKEALAFASKEVHRQLGLLANQAMTVQYPKEWKGEAVLVEVQPNTKEYSDIQKEFQSDGFAGLITKMERVQQPKLWDRYYQQRRIVKRDNNGSANERYFKHGTRATPPDTIYNGERGFDPRYSGDGNLFGRGAYFAERTSYSDAYSYVIPGQNQLRQLFIALVTQGRVEDRTSRSATSADKDTKHPAAGFHSVMGMVKATDRAVITYDLYQAYPAYLITYRRA